MQHAGEQETDGADVWKGIRVAVRNLIDGAPGPGEVVHLPTNTLLESQNGLWSRMTAFPALRVTRIQRMSPSSPENGFWWAGNCVGNNLTISIGKCFADPPTTSRAGLGCVGRFAYLRLPALLAVSSHNDMVNKLFSRHRRVVDAFFFSKFSWDGVFTFAVNFHFFLHEHPLPVSVAASKNSQDLSLRQNNVSVISR